MSKRENYEAKTEELLTPILERLGFDLWDVEYVKEGADYYLRAYIDKEGGITIDDCVDVSRALSDELDREDYIEDAYILEVSSPGLTRALKKDRDFERSIGRMIELKTYRSIDGSKEFTGTLTAYDKDSIRIDTGDGERDFARADLARVNLYADL
ncbi:MAG TPA: ribosome maturation factor RimP [Lachnospiraceae bacterium]|nr:ribosome maturation factor RimP [Lachnospiraceae bacterium]